MVVVLHQGCYKGGDGRTMVVFCMNYLPDGVENVAGRADITLANRQLEVAHLAVESRWHLVVCEGHWKIGKEADAIDMEIVGQADGVDDGAWTNIDECASSEVTVLQVEVDMSLATHDNAEAMIVDDEWWFLAHQQAEHSMISTNDTEFAIEEYVLADLCKMRGKYVPHAPYVHQLRLLAHKPSFCWQR